MDDYMINMWNNPPTQLANMTSKPDEEISESIIKDFGDYTTVFGLICSCGNDQFKIIGQETNPEYSGVGGKIKTECNTCNNTFEIFNSKLHGYEGALGISIDTPDSPLKEFNCSKCQSNFLTLNLGFQYSGDEAEIIEEDKLDVNPQDLFGWLVGIGRCTSCGSIEEFTSTECQ